MTAAIEAWDLVKEFDGFAAVDQISLAVAEALSDFSARMGQGKLDVDDSPRSDCASPDTIR
jgi:hypothetical protein